MFIQNKISNIQKLLPSPNPTGDTLKKDLPASIGMQV
jgi:hypothetical protein